MLRQLLRPIARNVTRRGERAYHPPSNVKRGTMDEIPVPQGSWQENYDRKQKLYNLQLAIGLTYFGGTMTYIISTGAIFLNRNVPVRTEKK